MPTINENSYKTIGDIDSFSLPEVTISITGSRQSGKTAVANFIHKKLKERGFNNIDVMSPYYVKKIHEQVSKSIIDLTNVENEIKQVNIKIIDC